MAKHSRARQSHAAHPDNSGHYEHVHTGYAINLTETAAKKPDHNGNASSGDKRRKSDVLSRVIPSTAGPSPPIPANAAQPSGSPSDRPGVAARGHATRPRHAHELPKVEQS